MHIIHRSDRKHPWVDICNKYELGHSRPAVFRDLVLQDVEKSAIDRPVILDIGCGHGFDLSTDIQNELIGRSSHYIGVEPDKEIRLNPGIVEAHRTLFEDASVKSNSVDIAFSVMVLEHVKDPEVFWEKLHDVLKPGGIFWGFTVDSRHWFVHLSQLTEFLGIKDIYLDLLHGKRMEDRYENYETYYRCNSPKDYRRVEELIGEVSYMNFNLRGGLDFYFPGKLKWFSRITDILTDNTGLPGTTAAVRIQKRR